jgi:hypothetical protein
VRTQRLKIEKMLQALDHDGARHLDEILCSAIVRAVSKDDSDFSERGQYQR